MMDMGNDVYLTKDLYEGAFLYAKHLKLLRLERENRYFWFVFQGKNSCEEFANSYWARKCLVNAKDYADAIRTLKDRLFARR